MDYVRRQLTLLLATWLVGTGALGWAEDFAVTFPAGPLAVWSAGSNRTVAVGTSQPEIQAAAGWKIIPLTTGALHGVEIFGKQPVQATKQGQGWRISNGSQRVPQGHALLLNDGWQLGGQPLRRVSLEAAGSRWQVGLSQQPLRQGQALVGAVQRLGRATTAIAEVSQRSPEPVNFAALEPAAGLSPTATPQVSIESLLGSMFAPIGLVPLSGPIANAYQPGTRVALPALKLEALSNSSEIRPSDDLSLTTVSATVPSIVTLTTVVTGTTEPATAAVAVSPTELEEVAEVSPTLPPLTREANATMRSEELVNEEVGVLIPPRGRDYVTDTSEALQAVADAPVGSSAAREARLALTGVYLAWQRPEEALAVLATFPARTDGLPAQAVPRLLFGVAQLARGQLPQEGVFDQRGTLLGHAQLWAAVAANARGAHSTAATEWPTARGIMPEYPEYLRALAQAAQINALVMTGQFAAALQGIETLAAGYGNAGLPPALKRLQGLAKLGLNQNVEGLEDLAAAAENTTDATTAAQAKLEFIRILHRRKEISDAQLRGYLRDLQQEWRGNDTERQTLAALAELYAQAREPSNALQTWQTLIQAFPNTPDMPNLTNRMAEAFVEVFDPEAERTYDPLTYLGLYYDFRELLPNDERGDLVQERMAEALVRANLFARAVPILEQQLQYRALEAVPQGRLTLLLAQSKRNLGQPEEALKLLDNGRALASTQTLRRGWALEEARTLMLLNRPQQALAVLQPLVAADRLEDIEAQALYAHAAWQGQDWPTATAGFNRLLAKVPASGLVSSTAAQLHAFHLAYALAQQKDAKALAELKARYQEAWPQLPELADDINAVAASAGVTGVPPDGGPLQQLTTALSGINSLDDQIANLRRELRRTRNERDDYNRRMQYMELLPPPAL